MINYKLIKEITEEFVFYTYGNEIPDGYCFSLCYPLSVLFSLMEIEHEITFGKSHKKNMEISHFWITLDKNETILDPTIKQFNQEESSVYLGNIHKNETTRKYIKIENTGEAEFKKTYDLWSELLFQHIHRRTLPSELEIKLMALNVAASEALFFYINKYDLKEKLLKFNYGLLYFKPISSVLQQKYLLDKVLIRLNERSLKYKEEIIGISS